MPIVLDVPKQVRNPADELRDLLDRCEINVANLERGAPDGVLTLLEDLDRAYSLLEDLRRDGVDLRPEETRMESIQSMLRRKAAFLVREARKAGGLPKLREQVRPDESRWWWYADELVAQERRQKLVRLAKVLAAVVVVLVGAGVALRVFFPPDPRATAILRAEQEAALKLDEGDVAGALNEIERGLQDVPDDPGLWIWHGVLLEKLGRDAEAQESFAKARDLWQDDLTFFLNRGQRYLEAGEAEAALADAQRAAELDARSAEAHMLLANAYESLGKVREAYQALVRAAELAREQGNDSLYVIAQTRAGYMAQRLLAQGINQPLEATPTPASP